MAEAKGSDTSIRKSDEDFEKAQRTYAAIKTTMEETKKILFSGTAMLNNPIHPQLIFSTTKKNGIPALFPPHLISLYFPPSI